MADKNVAFSVRRARLLLGMTEDEFALLYGVDKMTVSRWEGGFDRPKAEVWARLRTMLLKVNSALDDEMVKASPIYKFVVDMQDLTRPLVASKAIKEALEAAGASYGGDRPFDIVEIARKSPDYEVSGIRALEIIQADPDWLHGDIVYAEAHCVSAALGGIWLDGMIAPLPERIAALIEFSPSKRGRAEGFRVNLVRLQDMPFNRPS